MIYNFFVDLGVRQATTSKMPIQMDPKNEEEVVPCQQVRLLSFSLVSQTTRHQNGNHCQHQNFRSKCGFGAHGIESIPFEDFFLDFHFGVHGIESIPISVFSVLKT